MKFIKRLICKIFGHNYFVIEEGRILCSRCGAQKNLNLNPYDWERVDSYYGDKNK